MHDSFVGTRPKLVFLTTCIDDTESIQLSSVMALVTGSWELSALSAPNASLLKNVAEGLGIPFVPVPEALATSKTPEPGIVAESGSDIQQVYKHWFSELRRYDADYAIVIDAPPFPPLFSGVVSRFVLRVPENWPRLPHIERNGILRGNVKISVPVYRDAAVGVGFRIIAATKPMRIGAKDTSADLQKKIGKLIPLAVTKALERVVERGRKSGRTVRKMPAFDDEVHSVPLVDFRVDNHERIRKIQRAFFDRELSVFRVRVDNQIRETFDLELHKGDFPGRPGMHISTIQSCVVVRTREGCCILLDEKRPNSRNARFTPTQIKRLFAKKRSSRR